MHTPGAYIEEQLETDEPSKATLRKFKPIINNINLFIIKNLKKKRKSSPIQRLSVEINDSFRKLLLSKYEIGLKYKACNDFLFDLNLETERFIKTSSEANCKFFVKPGSFMIKLNKKSSVRYISTGEIPKIIEKNPSITVKFISTFSSLTSSDEAFLSNYI
jgi:hypothetical protein